MTPRSDDACRTAQYAGDVPDSLVGSLREVAATLVSESDTSHALTTITDACAESLGTSATVVMVHGALGEMRVLTASPDDPAIVALFEKHADNGPWVECQRTRRAEGFAGPDEAARRWPDLAADAATARCDAALSMPMLLAGDPVGAVTLLYDTATRLSDRELDLARLLTDMTTLSLCQEPGAHRVESLARHTVTLLNERVQLEHAIGMVAGRLDISVSDAQSALHRHAQTHGLLPSELARSITLGVVDIGELAG